MRKEIPIVSLLLLLPVCCHGADWKNFRADAKRMEERVSELSKFGANPEGGVSRVAFSDADVAGRKYIRALMEKAGLKVRVDAAETSLAAGKGAIRTFRSSCSGPILILFRMAAITMEMWECLAPWNASRS